MHFRFFDNVFSKGGSMLMDTEDGICRDCGGQFEITDADDATMEVECTLCHNSMTVEIDYFNDGGIKYWPEIMAVQQETE